MTPHINDYDAGPTGPPNVDPVPAAVLAHAVDHVLRTAHTADRRFVDRDTEDAYYLLARAEQAVHRG